MSKENFLRTREDQRHGIDFALTTRLMTPKRGHFDRFPVVFAAKQGPKHCG
jgi:hypothetical protein